MNTAVAKSEPATSPKILAYDGDCPMCTSTVGLLLRWKLVRPEQAQSNHALDADRLALAYAAGMRNELVVIDARSGETRVGTDGLLWILRDNTHNHFLVRALGLPGIRHLLRIGYQVISYNRRIISPPRHSIVCDCEPEVTVARRLSLVLPLLLMTIAITALFGAAVFVGCELGPARVGTIYVSTIDAVTLGALALVCAIILPRDKRLDYFAHAVVTIFVGSLVLLPAIVVVPLCPQKVSVIVTAVASVASAALMLAMQRRRIHAVGLSSPWDFALIAILAASMVIVTVL
jgi:predicted DCC family thiol-disulfide oxidoreductase YuxK/uncharacterized membrane protein YhaH (DUF805 family)